MNDRPSEEQLNAYVDGELDAAEVARIETLLEQDAALAAEILALRECSAVLRGAYQEPLSRAVPDSLHAAIDEAWSEQRPERPRQRGGSRADGYFAWWPTAAAAVLAAAVALPFGFLLSDLQWERSLRQEAEIARSDAEARLAALDRGLEQLVSGESLEWNNPDSDALGVVVPVRTFKSASGHWCREYEARTERGSGEEVERGIACRNEGGTWERRIVLAEES